MKTCCRSSSKRKGWAMLECENLDEAIEWANKIPLQSGAIEIRAVMDLSVRLREQDAHSREGDRVAALATRASRSTTTAGERRRGP